MMNATNLKKQWLKEEAIAHIHGWDFSHLRGRYTEETDLPWDYEKIIRRYLKPTDHLLDIDTGGGEFLMSLHHFNHLISCTEAYPPNIKLCEETLLPLGVHFKAGTYDALPFDDESFDIIINRHGSSDSKELLRVLKPGGIYITEMVGENNDRELVELLLPGTPKPFHGLNLADQKIQFEASGFTVLEGQEAYRPITFFDVGALIWFARVIEWEFPEFSVSRCYDRLVMAQKILEENGSIDGSIHRYLIVASKKRI